MDLDGFKPVNDTYGHSTGDELLKEASARLLTCIREGDTAARIGGDEFIVILLESSTERAVAVANRILASIRSPYELGKRTIVDITASIGIAEFPGHANEMDALIDAADKAMYAAKKHGKNRYCIGNTVD